MKKLYLVRHAKSTREFEELPDFERPLNTKGRLDAPLMADHLRNAGIFPDLIISSPATRALATARLFADHLSYPLNKISVTEDIYEAWRENLIEVIRRIDPVFSNVILIGHNPGLHLLSEYLVDFPYEKIPTSGIIGIEFSFEDWKFLSEKTGRLLFFDFPKKIRPVTDK